MGEGKGLKAEKRKAGNRESGNVMLEGVMREAETRLPVQTVERMHRLIGGEAQTEMMVLRFIADRYGVSSLVYLPERVARQVLLRPGDFLRAVKKHCEPELF